MKEQKTFFERLLNSHRYDEHEEFLKEKVTTLNIIMLVMGSVIFGFALFRLTHGNYVQGSVNLLLVFTIIGSYIYLYKDKYKVIIIARILISASLFTVFVLIIRSPDVDTRFSWMSIAIYMMFFLLDLKEGIRWVIGTSIIIVALFLTHIIDITPTEFTIFFVATLVLALLLSRYEKIKAQNQEQYTKDSQLLQAAVLEKTQELTAQKEMFESLFQKSFDGLLIIEDQHFIECNDAILKMLGYDKKERLLNSHPSRLSPKYQPDGRLSSEKADEMMQICLTNGAHNFEWVHQKANGEDFWCDVTLTHLHLPNKDLIHTVWRDISKQKALQEENDSIKENLEHEVEKRTRELNIAMRSKSEFLANMSHEIRTPLNAMLGFIEILKKDETALERIKQFEIVHNSGEALLTIINDILDFSKIESGKFSIEWHPFELCSPFEEVQLLFFEKAKAKDIHIDFTPHQPLPKSVEEDIVRLKQIFSNLLSNAIKFTPEGGHITIDLSFDDKTSILSCSIRDTGIGIAPQNIAKIFDAFSQADSSTTRNYGGTGLGLSISKKLAVLMHGDIHVESTIDKGSTFTFTLLLNVIQESIPPAESETRLLSQEQTLEGTVLIVEDNKMNQMLIQFMLQELGLSHDTVENGNEAVEQVQKRHYDLILMDENMPIMNGIEATKLIRRLPINNDIPIVAVTANALIGDKEHFLEAGMDDYLSKPIESKAFKRVLARFLLK